MNIKDKSFQEFFTSFLETALWSTNDGSTPQGGEPLDKNFSIKDFTKDAREVLQCHAFSFFSRMWYYVEVETGSLTFGNAGHDFWLTMNCHGAGFWDGDWLKYGEMLTKLSKCYPEINLSVYRGHIVIE